MDKIHGNWGRLRGVEDRLIKDLKETTLPLSKLGKKYGVSKQAISYFCQRNRVGRPKEKREHTENCLICQSLIEIARQEHGDFISSPTIKKQLKVGTGTFTYHIRLLRKKGLISQWFGRIRSTKVERAYQIYFKKKLPIDHIGRQAGLKHFYAAIMKHRALGWDVPPSLFKYDTAYRRKAHLKMNKTMRRFGKGK